MESTRPTTDQPTMPRQEFFRLATGSLGAFLLMGCAGRANGDPAPDATAARKVDFVVRLSDKGNENLQTKGGYVIVNNVLVAHTSGGQFVAVAAGCTHEGTKLVYKPVENQFYCPLDLSRYDVTGKVVSGPASEPLQQYSVASDPIAGTLRVAG